MQLLEPLTRDEQHWLFFLGAKGGQGFKPVPVPDRLIHLGMVVPLKNDAANPRSYGAMLLPEGERWLDEYDDDQRQRGLVF